MLGLEKYVEASGTEEEGDICGLLYKGITWGNSVYLRPDEAKPTDRIVWNDWELAYPDEHPSSGIWKREYARWNGNSFTLPENIWDEAGYMAQWYVRNCAELDRLFGLQ